MKTNSMIASLIVGAVALIAAPSSHAVNRTLILLQENSSGKSYLDDRIGQPTLAIADAIIDNFVENQEAAKFQALASGSYARFVNLSDTRCTRARLLAELITQTNDGFVTDLAVLGHGNKDLLSLNGGGRLRGFPTYSASGPEAIRSMLSEARVSQNNPNYAFKLRVVHMCNCFGATLNDDWVAIGAKVSVGCPLIDWMPEPLVTFFWEDFVKNGKWVTNAAADALVATRPFWTFVPGYTTVDPKTKLTKLTETQQTLAGDGSIIFNDEFQMVLNAQKTFTVFAKQTHLFPLYFVPGQRYEFTCGSTDLWQNGNPPLATTSNANGYTPGLLDGGRRFTGANMMCLVGERFTKRDSNPFNFIPGSGFKIGTSRSVTFSTFGYLNLFANDGILNYGDNSGSIAVTIKRVQ